MPFFTKGDTVKPYLNSKPFWVVFESLTGNLSISSKTMTGAGIDGRKLFGTKRVLTEKTNIIFSCGYLGTENEIIRNTWDK